MRLSQRLALVFAVFGGAIAVGFQYVALRAGRAQMQERVEATAETASYAVQALVEAQMRGGKPVELGRDFNHLVRRAGIAAIVVKDQRGRRFVGRSEPGAAQRTPHPGLPLAADSDGYYDVERPVDLGPKKGEGTLLLTFYTGELSARLREMEIEGARRAVTAILAITVAAWLIGAWLGSSIERLVPRFEALPKDPAGFRPLRVSASGDEVSRLEAAFNRLGATLKDETLKRHRVEDEKKELSAMLVHDLKTPLTVINSGIALLGDQLSEAPGRKGGGDAQRRRTFELLNLSTKRLQRMVEDVLQLSRMEEVEGLRERASVDMAELARSCAHDLEMVAADRGQTLAFEAKEGLPPVQGDAALLRRVLDNLVHNAIEHTPSKSSVRISVEPGGEGTVKVSVADSGPGIPPEARSDIFKKFFQKDYKPHVGNVGLGLALCRKVVERHGGTIGVGDAQPRGACFFFLLPAPGVAGAGVPPPQPLGSGLPGEQSANGAQG